MSQDNKRNAFEETVNLEIIPASLEIDYIKKALKNYL